jgi:hypothetical protein
MTKVWFSGFVDFPSFSTVSAKFNRRALAGHVHSVRLINEQNPGDLCATVLSPHAPPSSQALASAPLHDAAPRQ